MRRRFRIYLVLDSSRQLMQTVQDRVVELVDSDEDLSVQFSHVEEGYNAQFERYGALPKEWESLVECPSAPAAGECDDGCWGWGWFDGREVQRCDTCKHYGSDDAAMLHVLGCEPCKDRLVREIDRQMRRSARPVPGERRVQR